MCVCVHMCVCVCVHVHAHMYVYARIHVCMCVCVFACYSSCLSVMHAWQLWLLPSVWFQDYDSILDDQKFKDPDVENILDHE